MTRAVCPGSYDPVTVGHLDVFARASTLFDEVVVAILHNPAKQGTFTVDERVGLIRDEVAHLGNVRVEAFADMLVVDVCTQLDSRRHGQGPARRDRLLVRVADGADEPAPHRGRDALPAGQPRHEHISSSLVKEVARFGGDITGLVPEAVRTGLLERLARS